MCVKCYHVIPENLKNEREIRIKTQRKKIKFTLSHKRNERKSCKNIGRIKKEIK
jgi:hypothetical protein